MPIDYFFNDALLPHLQEIDQHLKPDAVMVEYVFFSKAFEAFPASTHRVIDLPMHGAQLLRVGVQSQRAGFNALKWINRLDDV